MGAGWYKICTATGDARYETLHIPDSDYTYTQSLCGEGKFNPLRGSYSFFNKQPEYCFLCLIVREQRSNG
jgi:hypothetical protein